MPVHLPREEGYGLVAPVKNGPALGGYGAMSMNKALDNMMTTMPQQLRQSLTWDRGMEFSAPAAFKIETGTAVYFADPQSPWQRGTNVNTNGLLRQCFHRHRSVPLDRRGPRLRRERAQQQVASPPVEPVTAQSWI